MKIKLTKKEYRNLKNIIIDLDNIRSELNEELPSKYQNAVTFFMTKLRDLIAMDICVFDEKNEEGMEKDKRELEDWFSSRYMSEKE